MALGAPLPVGEELGERGDARRVPDDHEHVGVVVGLPDGGEDPLRAGVVDPAVEVDLGLRAAAGPHALGGLLGALGRGAQDLVDGRSRCRAATVPRPRRRADRARSARARGPRRELPLLRLGVPEEDESAVPGWRSSYLDHAPSTGREGCRMRWLTATVGTARPARPHRRGGTRERLRRDPPVPAGGRPRPTGGAAPEEVHQAAAAVLPALMGGLEANAQDPRGPARSRRRSGSTTHRCSPAPPASRASTRPTGGPSPPTCSADSRMPSRSGWVPRRSAGRESAPRSSRGSSPSSPRWSSAGWPGGCSARAVEPPAARARRAAASRAPCATSSARSPGRPPPAARRPRPAHPAPRPRAASTPAASSVTCSAASSGAAGARRGWGQDCAELVQDQSARLAGVGLALHLLHHLADERADRLDLAAADLLGDVGVGGDDRRRRQPRARRRPGPARARGRRRPASGCPRRRGRPP